MVTKQAIRPIGWTLAAALCIAFATYIWPTEWKPIATPAALAQLDDSHPVLAARQNRFTSGIQIFIMDAGWRYVSDHTDTPEDELARLAKLYGPGGDSSSPETFQQMLERLSKSYGTRNHATAIGALSAFILLVSGAVLLARRLPLVKKYTQRAARSTDQPPAATSEPPGAARQLLDRPTNTREG